MKNKEVKTSYDFNKRLHTIGRIWTFLGICLFFAVPVTIGLYFKVTPDWTVFGTSAVLVPLFLNITAGLTEPIIYAPMLGTNGEYLAFITGNLSNLKIPCVVKAQEITGTKLGTEENELVSTIAIATSTLVTVIIIAIIVLALAFSGLQEVIAANKTITTPAFGCVVYALFGSLGGKYVAKNPKLALFPAVIIVALSLILGFAGVSVGSMYLFIGIAICIVFALLQYKREKKKLAEKEERLRLEAIAAGISYDENKAIEKSWENGVDPQKSESEIAEKEESEIIETILDNNEKAEN